MGEQHGGDPHEDQQEDHLRGRQKVQYATVLIGKVRGVRVNGAVTGSRNR
ncbi:hypothetical protein [Streptomyces canus]